MLELIERSGNVLAVKAIGKLSHDDYQKVFVPNAEEIIKKHGQARVLFAMGSKFDGWEAEAMWDDAKFGMKHRNDFEKCAVVGGPKWVEWAIRMARLIMSGQVRAFGEEEFEVAKAWIHS